MVQRVVGLVAYVRPCLCSCDGLLPRCAVLLLHRTTQDGGGGGGLRGGGSGVGGGRDGDGEVDGVRWWWSWCFGDIVWVVMVC